MGSLDVAALFQSSRQPPHGPWPSLSRSINVAIEAMKYEYCAKNTVQFSTAGKHYPCHYKKALSYNGEIIESICAGLPDWRCSLLLQQWHSEDAKKVAQNQDSAIRKLSFEQGMV